MRPGALVLVFLLFLTPVLAFGAIVPVTQQPVSGITYSEAFGTQGFPVSAAVGNDVLVAWTDMGDRAGIWDTIVTAPNAFTPNPPQKVWSGNAAFLRVCWTGSTYLLIWQADQQSILTASLDRSGALIGQPRVVIPSGAFNGLQSIAWDGRRALVVATGFTVTTVMLFDASGSLVSGPTQLVAKYSSQSAVATIGDTFTVFYLPADSLAILATRVRDTGDILDETPHFVIEPQHTNFIPFRAASDGHRIALAYADAQNGTFMLRRAYVDPTTFAVQPLDSYPTATIREVSLVWSGSAFVASWFEDHAGGMYNLMTLAYHDTEVAAPAVAAAAPGPPTFLSSLWTGRDLWFTFDAGHGDIDAVRADMNGAPAGPLFAVSTAVTAQTVAALAPGLVVWGEPPQDGEAVELFASPANALGVSFGARIQISISGNVAPDMPVTVVKAGSIYFVVWSEFTQTAFAGFVRRIRADGTLLDLQPVPLGGTAFSAAASGSTVVIPYQTPAGGFVLARYDANGNPLDPITLPFQGAKPLIASNGSEFLLVWNEGSDWWQFPTANALDVYGARLDATGQPIDTTKIAIAATSKDEVLGGIGSNGHDFVVAWTPPVSTNTGVGFDLDLQRVDASGTLDGAPQTPATNLSRNTVAIAAADNGGYWVAYDAGTYTAPLIWVAKTDAAGARLDSGPIAPVSASIAPGTGTPAIIGLGDAAVVAYARFDANLQVPRVFTTPVVPRLRTHAAGR